MFNHVSVGVRDLDRAARFYDAALGALGYKRTMSEDFGCAWGLAWPEFWAQYPAEGESAPGNGAHIAFIAASRAGVDAFHKAALAAGGSDAGAPGLRPDYTPDYYAAFVRDPDGNKLEAVYLPDVPFPTE
jgi:catechol 2,3-dioxygenase-like lactoylglutathione lyase family enzyme